MTILSLSVRTMGNPRYSSVSSSASASGQDQPRTLERAETKRTESVKGPPFVADIDDVLYLRHDNLCDEHVPSVVDFVVQEGVVADVDPGCETSSDQVGPESAGASSLTLIDTVLREEVANKLGDHDCRGPLVSARSVGAQMGSTHRPS